jgi:hypothetical protein
VTHLLGQSRQVKQLLNNILASTKRRLAHPSITENDPSIYSWLVNAENFEENMERRRGAIEESSTPNTVTHQPFIPSG